MTKEENKKTGVKNIKKINSFYNNLLEDEFNKETDRGAVILATSLFEINLESILKTYLVADTASKDELFEGATAPIGTFSSKINMAYRLGLISKKFARDLNLLRKIRNEFAHNIHGCTFDHSSVKSRVHELIKSSNIAAKAPSVRERMPDDTRGDFLICTSWMLWALISKADKITSLEECKPEWGYVDQDETKAMRLIQKGQEKKKQPDLDTNNKK